MDSVEKKTTVAVVGRIEGKDACVGGCEHEKSCGCGHHEQSEHLGCDKEGESCGGHNHGEGCDGCGGHSMQIPSDFEQFTLLQNYIAHVDMEDEIELIFVAWEEDSAEKFPRIAELMAQGYELPMVSIDGTMRLAGAVDSAKVVTIVNQLRMAQENPV